MTREIRSLTVAALSRMCVFADGYRAATVRERSPEPELPKTVCLEGTRFSNERHKVLQLGRTLMARARMMTIVKSEIVLSIIINILARCVSGKASVGLKAVAVLYPRYR